MDTIMTQNWTNTDIDIDMTFDVASIYRVIKKIGPVLTNVYCTLIFHNIIIDQYKILYTCPIFV